MNEQQKPLRMRQRLVALCDKWLAALEADAQGNTALKPGFRDGTEHYEWSDWRLKLVQCIAEANQIVNNHNSAYAERES